jgi:hypothetical protein
MQTPRNLTAQGPAKTQLNAGNAKTQLNAGNIAGAANSKTPLNAGNIAGAGNTVGQGGRTPGGPNQFQLAAAGNKPAGTRVLQNRFMANKFAAAGFGGKAGLAHATFKGNFAGLGWKHHHHHHFRPIIVIGWLGPLFWPYAYDDFIGYTFYPYAYDTFWPYAYDDLYDGMFGRYGYGYGGGGGYAATGKPQGSSGTRPRGGEQQRTVGADLCSGQTAGLTDWPIEQIAQTVEPTDLQRSALDGLRQATAQALDILKASCPSELPSTPTGRIEAMQTRLTAMLQAVRTVRPALETFYQSLNDEQKARFNALGPDDNPDQQRRDLAQACGERAAGIGSLPIERIERTVRPTEAQRAAFKELQDATSAAVNLLKSDCPTYRALTPVGRMEAMEQRLDAMQRAVQLVQPALLLFYGSLDAEQKERFNRLSPAQG